MLWEHKFVQLWIKVASFQILFVNALQLPQPRLLLQLLLWFSIFEKRYTAQELDIVQSTICSLILGKQSHDVVKLIDWKLFVHSVMHMLPYLIIQGAVFRKLHCSWSDIDDLAVCEWTINVPHIIQVLVDWCFYQLHEYPTKLFVLFWIW